MKNPTSPDSTIESSTSYAAGPSLAPLDVLGGPSTPGTTSSLGETNYNVFDPLNWLLDGLLDHPYNISDEQGMA